MKRTVGWLALSALAGLGPAAAHAQSFLDQAKATIAKATTPVTKWDGPTTGPRAAPHKLVVYVSTDQRNGGARGVGVGAEQAARVLGWDVRTLDGQGTVSGQDSAMSQAIALKPDGIILGGVDALQEAPMIERAEAAGIKVVGWHSGTKAGPLSNPDVFANITTDPLDVARVAADYAIVLSNGHAGVVIFTDSAYKVAIEKSDAMAAEIRKCTGCRLLATELTPIAQVSTRMPQLATSLLQRYGARWTESLGINDLYFDFIAPSLQGAGIQGADKPYNISAGDGSASAFERIRTQQYQVATVAEPLTLQGWECIDELNRAFNGDKWSGYVPPVHLFTHANINADGGEHNVYNPDDGYQAAYTRIWTGK